MLSTTLVPRCVEASDAHNNTLRRCEQIAFLFSSGFLMDAVRFRMQAVHRDTLQKTIQVWQDKHQSELKKIFLKRMLEDNVRRRRRAIAPALDVLV
jgi:hypothetical protein